MARVLTRDFLARALAGAAAFAAAQAFLFANPSGVNVPPPEHPGWFLNSLQGVIVIAAVFVIVAGLTIWLWPVPVPSAAIPLAAGGTLAMTATYIWMGAGNIFPIVLLVGAVCIAVAAFAGAGIARTTLRS